MTDKGYARIVQAKFKSSENPVQQARISGHGSVRSAVASGDQSFFDNELTDPTFHDFVGRAYASSDGVSFRVNPVTGEREMMIAGTRTMGQWGLNLLDTALYGTDKVLEEGRTILKKGFKAETGINLPVSDEHIKFFQKLDLPRQRKEAYYARLAADRGVDVVYGHSRGGAMAADLELDSPTTRVGLDAAMLLASNVDTINLNEGGGYNPLGLFDAAIGLTGKRNVHMDESTFAPHQVWL